MEPGMPTYLAPTPILQTGLLGGTVGADAGIAKTKLTEGGFESFPDHNKCIL